MYKLLCALWFADAGIILAIFPCHTVDFKISVHLVLRMCMWGEVRVVNFRFQFWPFCLVKRKIKFSYFS